MSRREDGLPPDAGTTGRQEYGTLEFKSTGVVSLAEQFLFIGGASTIVSRMRPLAIWREPRGQITTAVMLAAAAHAAG